MADTCKQLTAARKQRRKLTEDEDSLDYKSTTTTTTQTIISKKLVANPADLRQETTLEMCVPKFTSVFREIKKLNNTKKKTSLCALHFSNSCKTKEKINSDRT